MTTNLYKIQAQRQDWITSRNGAWTDGFPVVGQPGFGGAIAGGANVGNGGLVVASVDVGTALGVHVVEVAGIGGGLTRISVTDPDGEVTGQGVVGLPLVAGGIAFTLSQGATPFAPGDTFAIAVLRTPLDLTGVVFTLDSRMSAGAATYALQATSAPADGTTPTIAVGALTGSVAMRLPVTAMGRLSPGAYPYNVLAFDPVADPDGLFPVIAFFGVITHAAVLKSKD